MADLGELDRAGAVKIAGSPSTGIEDNYLEVDANGNAKTFPVSAGPVTPGAVAVNSNLIGGQFNTALPTLTNTQQSAIQVDSSGRLLISPSTQGALAEDHNYGTVGANTLRTASQIGNATGAAAFGAGTTSAQVLRVVLPTDQTAIPVSQSGTWSVGRTWTLSTGTDSILAAQSGTWTVQPGNTANTTPWLVTDSSDGPVTPGTVAAKSSLAGGQFNTVLPTLTTGQQSALQVDSSGRLIISPSSSSSIVTVSNLPTTVDTNYGTVGASTIRTASQIGNATGSAAFGAGTTSAQVLRVVLPTDQTAIPVSQSGTWSVGRTWTLSTGTDSILAAQSGTWTVQPGNTANTTPWLVTDSSDGPVGAGTAAAKSSLAGGVFNTVLPTLTTGQQSAIQLDSSGRLIIAPTAQGVLAEDHNYGTVGANTLRTASQIGNATGSADFNAGATGAQTLRTTSNQGSPGTAANAWFEKITDGTNTAAVKAASTAAVATDPALVVAISPNNTVAVTQSTSPWVTKDQADGPVTPGAVASFSELIGGQFNTTLPTLTNGQQAAVQVDSSGRLLVSGITQDVAPATQNITVQDTASTTNAIANGQSSFTGTPTAGSAASFAFTSEDTVTVQVTGTWTGTLQVEVSLDGGTTWYIRTIHQAGGSSAASFSSFTANFAGGLNVGGWTNMRVRAISAMTGTAIVKVIESINPNSVFVANAIRLVDSSGDLVNVTPNNDLQVADISNTSAVYGNKTVTTSAAAVRVGASNLTNRKVITILNNGSKTIYWGFDASVTTSNGTPLVAAQQGTWNIGAAITIFMISSSGNQDVRVAEMA